ncbi:hypothetical protein AB5I83_17940 [Mesobacillus sp. LC4]
MKIKKRLTSTLIVLTTLTLLFMSLSSVSAQTVSQFERSTLEKDGFEYIEDKPEFASYLLETDEGVLLYEEVIKSNKNKETITTSVFSTVDNEKDKLIEKFKTTISKRNGKVEDTEQEIIKEKEPVVSNEYSITATYLSNYSRIPGLHMHYVSNYTNRLAAAGYGNCKGKSGYIIGDYNYGVFTKRIDSMRIIEEGSFTAKAIEVIGAGATSLLKSGKLSVTVVRAVLGITAALAEAWNIGNWVYHYNGAVDAFYKIPPKTTSGTICS